MDLATFRVLKPAVAMSAMAFVSAALPNAAHGQVSDFALFGAGGVTLNQSAKVRGGAVGSNGNIYTAAFNEVHGLYAGGSLLPPNGGGGTYDGPVVVNGSASIGAVVNGSVNVGGSVSIYGTVNGNVTAGESVYGNFPSTITGNVRAGGNFLQSSGTLNGNAVANGFVTVGGTVNGNVTYGSGYLKNLGGNVTGSVTQAASGPVTPESFTPRTLPGATSFTSGGANVVSTSTLHLAPGSYGDLSMGVLNDLYLTGGDYFFNAFYFDGFTIHLENVSPSSPIHIYVTGDLVSGSLGDMTVNGMTLTQLANTQPQLAQSITWETHGDFLEQGGSNDWAGTIFVPNGNATFGGSSQVVGRVYASGTITAGTGFGLNVVPEPAALAAIALLTPLVRRSRR